jgi:carbonic anhydrase
MRRTALSTLQDQRVNRRSFLTITGIATGMTILGAAPAGRLVYAAALTKAQRDTLTPDDIIALMKKGNQRFRLGQESPHNYLAQQRAAAMYDLETGLVDFFG